MFKTQKFRKTTGIILLCEVIFLKYNHSDLLWLIHKIVELI